MLQKPSEPDIQAFVLAMIRHSECVPGEMNIRGAASDPDDDKVDACAVEGKADFIVTGDKALLGLERYRDIWVLSAEAFIRALDGQ